MAEKNIHATFKVTRQTIKPSPTKTTNSDKLTNVQNKLMLTQSDKGHQSEKKLPSKRQRPPKKTKTCDGAKTHTKVRKDRV